MKRFLTNALIIFSLGTGTICSLTLGQQPRQTSPFSDPFDSPPPPVLPTESPFGDSLGQTVSPKISDSQKVRKAIEKNIVMDYFNTPFSRIIDDVSKKLDIPIVIHRKGVESAGISVDARVTFGTSDFQIPAKSALTLLLDQYDLGYVIENDVLKVTSKELVGPKHESVPLIAKQTKRSAVTPKEQELDSKIDVTLQEYISFLSDFFKYGNSRGIVATPSEMARATRSKLEPLLEEQFSIRQNARAHELAELETEVARMRYLHQNREGQKAPIVKDRIDQLLKDASGLGWGSSVVTQLGDKNSVKLTPKTLNEAIAETKITRVGLPMDAEEVWVIWCLKRMLEFDKDSNGAVSVDEWPGASAGEFTAIDTNQNGALTLAEYYIWKKAQSK